MRHAAALIALLPVAASADEVHLRSGGRLTGVVVLQTADAVVVEAEPGRITLPAAHVVRVVAGPSALAAYRDRAARLVPGDVAGWVALGLWARERDLMTPARQAFEHVLRVDPGNATAHQALGHVLVGADWLTRDESYRARGFVPFEGAWMRPDEMQAVLAERAAAAESERARAEAEARVREAEARARAAEAEARRLEAEADLAGAAAGGIPYDFVLAGGVPLGFHGGGLLAFQPPFVHPPVVAGHLPPACHRPPKPHTRFTVNVPRILSPTAPVRSRVHATDRTTRSR